MQANPRIVLSALWILLTVNFIFCDVFTLMHAADLRQILNGQVGDMEITQEFLLAFGFIMEIPMLMIVLSLVLKYQLNRILNIIFGILLLIVQAWSLGVGDNTLHYIFFSIIEILTCATIIWYAWKWNKLT